MGDGALRNLGLEVGDLLGDCDADLRGVGILTGDDIGLGFIILTGLLDGDRDSASNVPISECTILRIGVDGLRGLVSPPFV